ncbi:Na+/H+ antiporter subunit G [Paraburkholderia silvatlantica]|uniref:Multicomponent K+:H+ antiporter subunit G n=1 Tax=Paraburkholderia silvatlantica TaxID=321895 RepID=A0A2U1AGG3_9BURK|nr:Na+/H+ antiporter subunit G [Paraburkholderia silvatlantica]MBB2928904.1 multicomponent K+:H+ antiporter subunit G [Paraburkholderia silvatlantica]PVY35486.1 multisubunit potassium/proton antiporter PhaG subunit [Paraburkholderia silvatlantica]PXW41128.1 multisubunit potassium/proton antiporter PhaG subunit [Paraburkholderia silvatlantica]PYE27594.1 multisubunit potassium/proton antiporter PhaG subunit [Paraburkholderia silvatlantica]TDQ98045.1 multisubunit potassium/proton antiporter PhaG 
MQTVIEAIVCVLLLLGSAFTLIGAIGLARLPDFYMRLHGPTKSTTLGVGGVVLASVVYFSAHNNFASLHEVLIPAFLFLTAPISAHMLTKAGIQQRVAVSSVTRGRPDAASASASAGGERARDANRDSNAAQDS